MEIRLEPKSVIAFQTEATEVLYGGAAGGMKSFTLRASAIRWCAEVPGIQVYLFRRTLPDLRDNHLRGPTSLHVMLEPYVVAGQVKYRAVENEFEFWNGSVLHLCYCDSENDVEKYRGAEIHVLLIDELTHFSEYQYRFLRSRVRAAGLKIPEKYRARLPRIETASNPGSIGHAWVKRTFIAPKPEMEIWRAASEEGGMLRQFIPSKLSDNPYLTRDDPSYADRLRGMGSDNLVRAMLEGDWDIIAGQAFEKLRREVHAIEPFEPPSDWLCFGSLDWGSSRPFSFGLWTVANGNALPDGRAYRRGAMIRFSEVYGWNGKPNEGLRLEPEDVADRIKSRVAGRRLAYTSADPSIWKVDGGPSMAERFLSKGVVLRKADNSRLVGYVEVRSRIAGDEDGPMLYVTKNCHAGFWRTMPDLVMDERHVEDVDCWVAGTMISTPSGDVPIETVKVGDFVDTPIGPRRVLKSYVSGPSETVWARLENGTYLRGTPYHKVFVDGRGLVPLSQLEPCYDPLITKGCSWQEKLLYFSVLFSRALTTITTEPTSLRTGSFGCWLMEKYRQAITSITRITTAAITALRILSAFQQLSTPRITMASVPIFGNSRSGGQALMPEGRRSERTCSASGKNCRKGGWRADIVESLLRRSTPTSATALSDVRRTTTGSSRSAKFATLSSKLNATQQKKSERVRIVAVGRSGEKTPVYNLTVDQAHLFYANGVLSSNTDQEDHCYDEVRYACMSRPWMQAPHKDKAKPDRWMRRFEAEEETAMSWKVV